MLRKATIFQWLKKLHGVGFRTIFQLFIIIKYRIKFNVLLLLIILGYLALINSYFWAATVTTHFQKILFF